MRKYQDLWGQAAMASSIRDRIHRLLDQKITLTYLPAQICTPHSWALPPTDPVVVRPHGPRYEILSTAETWLAAQRAGWREVPVDVRDDITDEEAEAILALTSVAGRSDPSEEARQLEAHLERLCAERPPAASRCNHPPCARSI